MCTWKAEKKMPSSFVFSCSSGSEHIYKSPVSGLDGPFFVVEQIRRMRGGSQSHLMRCANDGYYIIKFQGNPQGSRILVNEMIGTLLAAHLGLATTPIALCYVSQDLIRLSSELFFETPNRHTPCQPGLQFGSRYPGNPHLLTVLNFLPDKQLSSVRNISDFVGMLVFDLWTCNTDPRQVIFGRQEIGTPYQGWMIDQGFCFNGGEWNFPDKPRRNLYDRKVVYEQVTGIETFKPWLDVIESQIDAKLLLEIAKAIPPEWYEFDSESLRRLLEQLDSRRGRVRELLWAVRESTPLAFPKWIDGSNYLSWPVVKSDNRSTPPVLLQVQRQELGSEIEEDT